MIDVFRFDSARRSCQAPRSRSCDGASPLPARTKSRDRYPFAKASCPKTRTNSRPASARAFRIDASTLASPREAGMLGHEHADPTLDVLGRRGALLHGPEQIADLPVPVAESPGAVRIGHPERSHLVEYLAPNSVFNSLPRQRSSPHLRPDDRLVTIDRVLHHASLGVA